MNLSTILTLRNFLCLNSLVLVFHKKAFQILSMDFMFIFGVECFLNPPSLKLWYLYFSSGNFYADCKKAICFIIRLRMSLARTCWTYYVDKLWTYLCEGFFVGYKYKYGCRTRCLTISNLIFQFKVAKNVHKCCSLFCIINLLCIRVLNIWRKLGVASCSLKLLLA